MKNVTAVFEFENYGIASYETGMLAVIKVKCREQGEISLFAVWILTIC